MSEDQRLELLFAGYVLGQLQPGLPAAGTIVDLDGRIHRVPLSKHYARLDPIIATLRAWMAASPADLPHPSPVILNKHCPQCPFRTTCAAEAEHDDDLSLLARITPKARQRYRDRGIFTVRQLSYLFRPRKKRRHTPAGPVHYQPELQALALRTGKTYLHELPALTRQRVELFLDVEGIPDRRAYYLLGLLVCNESTVAYHAFWADAAEDEERMWRQLLATLNDYPNAPVYHYGQYDARAVATLAKRYGTDGAGLTQRLVNLTAAIHGKVYFPVRSNRLKDIGRFLGVSWTAPEASGLQSLVWRHRWEKTRQEEDKQHLLTYNEEDCRALRALANELTRLRDSAATQPAVDFAAQPERQATDTGEEIHRQLGAILRSAHAGYEHAKISLRQTSQSGEPSTEKRRPGAQPGHPGYNRIVPKAGKVVQIPPRPLCPHCDEGPLQPTDRLADKTIIDLVFTNSGCRKTITKYVGPYSYCPQCGRHYPPLEMAVLGTRLFGHGLRAWVIYQRLVLRLPYCIIAQVLDEQFRERMNASNITPFMQDFARDYAETEDRCRQQLLASRFIHVDETKINVQGTDQYVWVFTDGKHVLFRLTPTREAAIVREVLAGYDGILVSDFYAGYDAVNCRQQKCLVHLIRDLNEDLWHAPFDTELEAFVLKVRDLLVPILEAAGQYGLKKRHLGKFLKTVHRFYDEVITGRTYQSEVIQTYQKRFKRYRHSLFTFLEHDGIPWNNNMAERAIRHLAVQRKISMTFFASAVPQYLLLLGLAQTCRFQDKSLLRFLLSCEKDIDAFKAPKRARSSIGHGVAGQSGQA
ncbi:MAG: IS66 family transposase [Chloroflexota bacterium]|nr:IS66 family transposase [Chloroflexota bacterium]